MYLEPLAKDQFQRIYAELNINEEQLDEDVRSIQQWLKKQLHLPDAIDEQYLTNFLVQCKNSVERTKVKLERYLVMRAQMPEVFSNYDPCDAKLVACMQRHQYVLLPKHTPDGDRILIYYIHPSDEQAPISPEHSIRFTIMNCDIFLARDQARSFFLIYDVRHVDKQLILLYFNVLKKLIPLIMKSIPLRPVKIYVINVTPEIRMVINFCRTMLSKKIADRIEVWTKKPSDLAEVLPKDVLPSDYGGTERSIAELKDLYHDHWKTNREVLVSFQNMQADLSKLPKEHELSEEVAETGMEGTFRKITID